MKRLCVWSASLVLASCSPPDITTGDTRVVGAYAIDGDTFKVDHRRYRIEFIDAPELPGHCRVGRICVLGDPWRSKDALQAYLDNGVTCRASGLDYYKRTLVSCRTWEGRDLGSTLIQLGYAQEYRYVRASR